MRSRVRVLVCASFLMISLAACSFSKPYDIEAAVDRGDIVDVHGKVSNAERLEEFNQNILQDVKDKVRIIRFTVEGDPIFYDIQFTGQKIKFKYDSSKDQYGTGGKQSTVCESLVTREIENGIEYRFDGCSGNNKDIGDNFEFKVID